MSDFVKNWPFKLLHLSEKYIKMGFFVCFLWSTIYPAIAHETDGLSKQSHKTVNNPESVMSFTLNKGINQTIFQRHNQKNISSYNLDFSGNTLATIGTFNDYKLLFDNKNFNLGFVYGEAKSRAQLNTVLQGSSSALFSDATLTSHQLSNQKALEFSLN